MKTAAAARSGTHSPTRRARSRIDSNADRANDHYHRYKEDVGLIKDLGVKAYRFSIAWPRVFPEGTGAPNPKGLDFYDRLVDELLTNGIEPYATLYHWDLPQALQDRVGGWQSSDTSKAFADYAGYVAERLTDRVKNIFTVNEAGTVREFRLWLGHRRPRPETADGRTEPGRVTTSRSAHGLAVQAIRAQGRAGTRVGPAENIAACVPAIDTPENVRAAEIATRELNAGFLGVILEGKYTDGFLEFAGDDAPKFTAEELKIISSPIDFVGLNIYAPQFYVVASDRKPGLDVLPFPASFPHMNSEWLRIGPETIYWVPRIAAKIWNIDTIYISENGTSSEDKLTADGQVYDLDRVMYPAQLSDPAAARHIRGRAGPRLFPVEPDGQFRMDLRVRTALRTVSRRFRDPGARAQAQRVVLSRRRRAQCDRRLKAHKRKATPSGFSHIAPLAASESRPARRPGAFRALP